eukprot:SAG22_NODE_17_length_32684_cov_34.234095_22_plen_41_part_00
MYRCYELDEEADLEATPLGWVAMYLFDDSNQLRQGAQVST